MELLVEGGGALFLATLRSWLLITHPTLTLASALRSVGP